MKPPKWFVCFCIFTLGKKGRVYDKLIVVNVIISNLYVIAAGLFLDINQLFSKGLQKFRGKFSGIKSKEKTIDVIIRMINLVWEKMKGDSIW